MCYAQLVDAVGVTHGRVLPGVRVTYESIEFRAPRPGRHVECLDDEVGAHRATRFLDH